MSAGPPRAFPAAAVLVAALTLGVTICFNTFAPWGTDAAGYIEAAHRWAEGRPIAPSPLPLWASWAQNPYAVAPFGFRPGNIRGTDVSQYPPGLSLFMAAAIATGGELAAYLVPPLFAAVLIWCAYVLGAALAGPWAGLLAAALTSMSPLTLILAIQPLSDVPAAALWMLAWVMSLRPGVGASAASGAAVAAAILVRPNLAPLVVIVLALLVTGPGRLPVAQRWWRGAVFGAVAAIGPGVLGWSQAAFYGGPLTPGYMEWASFYHVAHIRPNLKIYPRHLSTIHTPLVFMGLLVPALGGAMAGRLPDGARAVAYSATAVVLLNYALYLPYSTPVDLFSLRFVLPGTVALFVLLAGLVARLAVVVARRSWLLGTLAIVPAALVALSPVSLVRYALDAHESQARIRLMGHYLREVLPANAAVLTSLQGTAVAHFTKRLIVRLDPIDAENLDAIVSDLVRHAYRPYCCSTSWRRFPASRRAMPHRRCTSWTGPPAPASRIGRTSCISIPRIGHPI